MHHRSSYEKYTCKKRKKLTGMPGSGMTFATYSKRRKRVILFCHFYARCCISCQTTLNTVLLTSPGMPGRPLCPTSPWNKHTSDSQHLHTNEPIIALIPAWPQIRLWPLRRKDAGRITIVFTFSPFSPFGPIGPPKPLSPCEAAKLPLK